MATQTFTGGLYKSDFGFFTKVNDALITLGFTQTADTGQLALPVTTGVSSSTSYGYRIYKWNDSFSTSYPLYLKIDFRTSNYQTSTNYYHQGLAIYVGTGTDGAGNLTGKITYANTGLSHDGSSNNQVSTSYVSFADGVLTIVANPSQVTSDFYQVARLRKTDGTITGGATSIYSTVNRTVNSVSQGWFTDNRSSSINGQTPALYFPYGWWGEQPSTAIAGDIPFFGMYVLDPEALTQTGPLLVPKNDIGFGTTFIVNRFGTARTFMSLGANCAVTAVGGTPTAGTVSLAFLWE